MIVYYPVYKKDDKTETVLLKGLLEAVFELDVLLSNVYQSSDIGNFTYQLSYDENNIFAHSAYDPNRLFNDSVSIDIFDKKGQLSFSSTKKFEQGLIDWGNLAIMFFTCVVGVFCVMFVFFIANFNYRLTKKAAKNTTSKQIWGQQTQLLEKMQKAY